MNHVPVLIVGGGPIGLSASVLLSRFGVGNLLVNQRPTTSVHPRARFIDVRTVEILRQMDVADAVIDTGLPPEWVQSVRYSTSWDEPEVWRLPTDSYHSVPRDYSPTVPVMTSQDRVEPILLEAAHSYDRAEVRFGAELVELTQDAEGCRARYVDVETGAETEVTCDYVIGADGRRSTVRDQLGADLEPGFFREHPVQDFWFQADLSRFHGDRIGALLFVNHPRGYGLFQPLDGKRLWRAQCTSFNPPIAPGRAPDELCIQWIRSAIGDHDAEVELEVFGNAPWHPEAMLADLFQQGRVFLGGDAAHMLVPTGGLGMNLGYHGIHNLVWKLANVLAGHASPTVLDTYELERKGQSERTRVASIDNARLAGELYRTHAQGGDVAAAADRLLQYGNFEGLIMGYEYDSPLCRTDPDPAPPVDNDILDFVPAVRSGRRAPHVWLDQGQHRSIIDLFGADFVVVAGRPSTAVDAALAELNGQGLPVRAETLPDHAVADESLYSADEALLVRPDGFVAARWPVDESPGALAPLITGSEL